MALMVLEFELSGKSFRTTLGSGKISSKAWERVMFVALSGSTAIIFLRCGKVIAWFWPFSFSPSNESGWAFETNGLEGKLTLHRTPQTLTGLDESIGWPPPDPDRIPRIARSYDSSQPFIYEPTEKGIEAFRKRQEEDQRRWLQDGELAIRRRRPFHERYDPDADGLISLTDDESEAEEGEEGWKNSEGERLRDFGVDEETEFYDEDDVPLAELLRRRKATSQP